MLLWSAAVGRVLRKAKQMQPCYRSKYKHLSFETNDTLSGTCGESPCLGTASWDRIIKRAVVYVLPRQRLQSLPAPSSSNTPVVSRVPAGQRHQSDIHRQQANTGVTLLSPMSSSLMAPVYGL